VGRPENPRRVLLDSSCLIGMIKGDEDVACLASLMLAVQRHRVTLVESAAILTEVRPRHASDVSPEKRKQIRLLLQSADVDLIDVTSDVADRAGCLCAEHGLKTWDGIHLATAIKGKVDVLFTGDDDFGKDREIDGVWVCKPYNIDENKLFS